MTKDSITIKPIQETLPAGKQMDAKPIIMMTLEEVITYING